MAAGLDSLGAVELRNMLQESLSVRLPSTVVIDYPTVNALTGYVTQQLAGTAAAAAAAAAQPAVAAVARERVLVGAPAAAAVATGMPGSALAVLAAAERTPAAFLEWDVVSGVDAVGLVPLGRWDVESPASFSTAAR
jgi:hypothetical protein